MNVDVDLAAWEHVELVGPLGGGHRTEVHEVVVDGERAVARRTTRSAASLDWELDLLEMLTGEEFVVPQVIATPDGRRHVDGVVVQTWLDGVPPAADADWERVRVEIERLHRLTRGWPQRPGCRSVVELGRGDRSGDADLSTMPDDAVEDCLRAWRRLGGLPRSVIHGDPGADNLRLTETAVGLLDWDEARVDVSAFDLADLPHRPLTEPLATVSGCAADAWEAANGWAIEPTYARRRLARLRAGRPPR